jgi:hypothetical protein
LAKEEPPAISEDERQILWAVVRLQARVLALVGGLIGGGGLFLMTAWLLLKGGENVGAHLQLLAQYFYGYSVTWPGAAIGFAYGAVLGAAVGWLIGVLYNLVAGLRA